ncbi:MAG: 2-C-methyl-D-erythritol 4-phosphate cytidylyltransferase [Culicoidibacterales bacterium]
MTSYSAIILCAGSGTRSGLEYNKVFYLYEEKPLFLHAVESFVADEMCTQVIIVTKAEERSDFKSYMHHSIDTKVIFVDGGEERSDSVANAIEHVSECFVLIHDSARKGVDKSDLHELVHVLDSCDAALLGLPIADTVKRVRDGKVEKTEDRSVLFLAQTPQAFHTQHLKALIKKAQVEQFRITDEIMLVEHYQENANIQMLRGSKKYNKWTYEEDFWR